MNLPAIFQRDRSPDVSNQRAPKAATMNLTYRSPGSPQVNEWNAEEAFRLAYLSNVIVYRCVQIIAEDIAALPFRAGRSLQKPMDFNEGAPLARLLGPPPYGPNPETAADELWANAVAQYLVAGRFGWEIEYNGKTPVALWPLAAHRLQVIPTADNTRRSEYFEGFTYGKPGAEVNLSTDEVFYCWRPSLYDYRQPESALQAARLDISVAVMQDRYDNAFLRNDARPAAVMVVQTFADDKEYRAFKEQINAEYGGPDNAGKMMLLEQEGDEKGSVQGAVNIQTLGLSQKDAEFIKRHEMKFRNIAIAMGVPWSKLDASGRTFDNASEEAKTYWKTINGLLRKFQNRVNMRLAPLVGSEVGWFDLSEVEELKPPSKYAEVSLVEAVDAELVTVNEARTELGLEAVAGGDEFVEKQPPPPIAALPPAPLELNAAQAPEPEIRHPHPEPEPIDHGERRRKVWRRVDAQAQALEKTWQRSFRRLFARQEREAIKRLEGKRGRQMVTNTGERAIGDQIFDPEFWLTATREEATSLYEGVFTVGGARVAEYFGVAFDIESPRAQEFISLRANKLAGQVTDTTYKAIKDQLGKGVGLGEGIPELSARIRSVFADASGYRSEMIARTEVISSFNASTSLVASEYPGDVVGGQEWIATGGPRTRPEHGSADGQVVGIGEEFDVGGEALAYPGDPNGSSDNTVNCFPGSILFDSVAPVEGAYRRWYDGLLVTVRTAGGGYLTGTPNHPVLTQRGWAPLAGLKEGDYLVKAGLADDVGSRDPEVANMPTNAEQIFESLSKVGNVQGVIGSSMDFHGDGTDSEIEVVRAYGDLFPDENPTVAQIRTNDLFNGLRLAQTGVSRFGSGSGSKTNTLKTISLPSASVMGSTSDSGTLSTIELGHADSISFASSSNGYTAFDKTRTDSLSAYAEQCGEFLLGGTREISADEIIAVDVRMWSGQVFNLQTAPSWYIANGFIVHNCRCTIGLLTPEEFEAQREKPHRLIRTSTVNRKLARMALGRVAA